MSGNVYTYVIGVMKDLAIAIVGAVLAFLLSPGLLVRLPKNGSKVTVAAVHALVFGLLFYVLYQPLSAMMGVYEGAKNNKNTKDDNIPVKKTANQKASMTGAGKSVV
jgi:hypothetical protein